MGSLASLATYRTSCLLGFNPLSDMDSLAALTVEFQSAETSQVVQAVSMASSMIWLRVMFAVVWLMFSCMVLI